MWQISLNHINEVGNKRKRKECKTTVGFLLFYDSHMVSDIFQLSKTKPYNLFFMLYTYNGRGICCFKM